MVSSCTQVADVQARRRGVEAAVVRDRTRGEGGARAPPRPSTGRSAPASAAPRARRSSCPAPSRPVLSDQRAGARPLLERCHPRVVRGDAVGPAGRWRPSGRRPARTATGSGRRPRRRPRIADPRARAHGRCRGVSAGSSHSRGSVTRSTPFVAAVDAERGGQAGGPRASSASARARVRRRPRAASSALHDLAGTQQHRRRRARRAADDVGAPVHPVGEVDVEEAGGPEHDLRRAAWARGRRATPGPPRPCRPRPP